MTILEASNNLLRRRLQAVLNKSYKLRVKFKNIAHCATYVTKNNLGTVVARRTDGKDAKFIGLNHCGNAWLCPNCAPRAAEKTSRWIAGALEVAKKNNQRAFMITATIGHYREIPLIHLIDSIDKAFKYVFTQSTAKTGGYKTVKKFYSEVPRRHYIKTTEITWSYEYGWHPHLHILYFTDDDKWDKISEWEDTLNELWMNATKKYLTQSIQKDTNIDDESKSRMIETLNRVYEKKLERTVGIYFSKNSKNEIIKQTSSSYITGWGANKELTDIEAKTSKQPGHFSIMDILRNAVAEDESKPKVTNDNNTTDEELNHWWKLFFEIGYAVYKRKCRWGWSHTGLKKDAVEYVESLSEEEYKKKFMCAAKKIEWQTVCFIPSGLYENLYKLENYSELEKQILKAAITDDIHAIFEIFVENRLPKPLRNIPFKVKGLLQAAA